MSTATGPRTGPFTRASVPRSKAIRVGLAAALFVAASPLFAAPSRVVSMNLCTDQLAMMLAADGQLISVSNLAQDPRMSAMAEEAARYPVNHGRAEEIYLMRPDLVIAGQFGSAATVQLLQRLGVRVEVFPVAETVEAIRDDILAMGNLLGREEAAEDLLGRFDAGLERVTRRADRGTAALYYANGFTSGRETLAGEIVTAAGFRNMADDYQITTTSVLPLELLVMSAPDQLITGAAWPGQSRSEAILDHPALARSNPESRSVTDRDWVCGTPAILDAIKALH